MNHQFDELTRNLAQSVTRRAALKAFGLGLAGMALARLGVDQAQAITNGQLDGNGHPNVATGVFLTSLWPPTPAPVFCGSAILVHPRVLVWSGHATYQVENSMAAGILPPEDFRVSFASDASNPATWRAVSGLVTHPGYRPNPDGVGGIPVPDVGVLILEEPVTEISPAPLPPLGFLDALGAAGQLKNGSFLAKFSVVGYGVELGPNPGTIPFPPDGLRRVAYSEFQNLHDRWLYTDEKVAHDNGGSCSCDSGGPVFYVHPATGRETLVAVVSRGVLSVSRDYRVDTAEALDFINAVIAMVEAGEL